MSVLTDGKVGNVIFIEVICRKPTNSYLVFIFHSEVIQRRIIMQIGIAVFISNTNVNTLCIEVNNAPFADFTGKDHLATEILLDSAQLKSSTAPGSAIAVQCRIQLLSALVTHPSERVLFCLPPCFLIQSALQLRATDTLFYFHPSAAGCLHTLHFSIILWSGGTVPDHLNTQSYEP